MEIFEEKKDNVLIVGFQGRLDANTSTELQEKLIAKIDDGEKLLVVDFSQVDYISSAGLRVMLMAAKKLGSSNGKIALYAMKDHIKEVFEIAGFTSIFSIFASQDEALQSVKA